MSPAHTSRQLLIWSVPTFAILLSFLWYKRKKTSVRLDPTTSTRLSEPLVTDTQMMEPNTGTVKKSESRKTTSPKSPTHYSRSLSGVDTAPIDIKIPRSPPMVVSDNDLDLEIEKIKSMKNIVSVRQETSPEVPASPARQSVKNSPIRNNFGASSSSMGDENPAARGSSVDRDSANHSPADVMIVASPTLSNLSDNPSESDSGKGLSDVVTPPPAQSQEQNTTSSTSQWDTNIRIYEFLIPQTLVGRLIGRFGSFVNNIRQVTNARILIKRHPDPESDYKVCAIEGSPAEVDAALAMIKDKFPARKYPELSTDEVSFLPVVPNTMHIRLVAGINNETSLVHVVTPDHLFVQQPLHPTFQMLRVLNDYMFGCYGGMYNTPPRLPKPIHPGTICVAEDERRWHRATVEYTDPINEVAYVKFLDKGGFQSVPYALLRQVREDFMHLPFQASECFLANVSPIHEDGWHADARDTVMELCHGQILFTQVVDYCEDGVTPLVDIYIKDLKKNRVIMLNQELSKRGQAIWHGNQNNESSS